MSHAVITFSLLHDDVLYACTIFHVVSNYMPHKCDKQCPSYLLLYHILVKREVERKTVFRLFGYYHRILLILEVIFGAH